MKKIMGRFSCITPINVLVRMHKNEVIYPEADSGQLEQILNKQNTINGYKSVLNKDDILVAIDINRMKRFNKEKIEKKLTKEIEEKFPDKKILVSGDLKIRWELEKVIEKQLETED